MKLASARRLLAKIISRIDCLEEEARSIRERCEHDWRTSHGRDHCTACGRVQVAQRKQRA